MPKLVSIHEYVLRPGVTAQAFEQAIRQAQARGLLALPGLLAYHFVKGVRGSRRDLYAAIWTYESKEAWERLWGPVDRPHGKDKYPATWKIWEDEVLAPFLSQDPDAITYTAYEVL